MKFEVCLRPIKSIVFNIGVPKEHTAQIRGLWWSSAITQKDKKRKTSKKRRRKNPFEFHIGVKN